MIWIWVALCALVGAFGAWVLVKLDRQRFGSTSAVPAKLRFYLRLPWAFEAELEKAWPGPLGYDRLTATDPRPWRARQYAESFRARRAAEAEARETGP